MKSYLVSLLKFSFFCLALFVAPCVMAQNGAKSDSDNIKRQEKDRPNVIIVLTDDQGYGELSLHGNPVLKTPNIDQLAKQSIELTDFHVTPMCTPTRGELMTGLDAARNGAVNVSSGRALLHPDLPTIADFFSNSGYSTGLFGKWHLGDIYPYRPRDRGFDETIWFPSSHINSVPDYWGNDRFDDTYIHNGKREAFKGYCTDVFFEEAMKWMKSQAHSDKPFFVYLPTNAAHIPLYAPKEDIKAIKKAFASKSAGMEQYASKFANMELELHKKLIRYLAMIRNIDTDMGRLENFLKKEGLTDNTILVFMNDNGSTFGYKYYNAGMRGHKTQLWEGGHRVSFFIRWPNGRLVGPRKIGGVTTVQDLLPTLLDLSGIVPSNPPKFDGISLAPVLRGDTDVPEDRMVVINYSRMPFGFDYPSPASQSIIRRKESAVLWKNWRLLRDSELYNLTNDPRQQRNVIDKYPKIAERMRDHLNSWWQGVRKIANDVQFVTIGSKAENPVKLTSVEWQDVFVDQQKQIRRGDRKNSYWNLNVDKAGIYEFELRRWPRETNLALDAKLPSDQVRKNDAFFRPGIALPIAKARILINDKDSTKEAEPILFNKEKSVSPDDKYVTFTTHLKAGPIRLSTWFDDQNGQPICGAYYMYVRRK